MQVKIKQSTADKLTALAYINNSTTGQMIDALIEFAHGGSLIKDEQFQSTFNNVFELAVQNAKDEGGGWGFCHTLQALEKKIRDYEQAGEA